VDHVKDEEAKTVFGFIRDAMLRTLEGLNETGYNVNKRMMNATLTLEHINEGFKILD
jgi:hypothetical protein